MVKEEHTQDRKVKEEHKSKYTAREIRDFEEDLSSMNEKELLILILQELRRK